MIGSKLYMGMPCGFYMASMDVACLPKKSNKLENNTVSYKTILSVSTDYRDYRLGRKKTTCRYELLGSWQHCLSTLWYYIVLHTYRVYPVVQLT